MGVQLNSIKRVHDKTNDRNMDQMSDEINQLTGFIKLLKNQLKQHTNYNSEVTKQEYC